MQRTFFHLQVFEKNLLHEGLELEYERAESNGLRFIKIHAPQEVLRRYSEILKLRMPMKEVPGLRVSAGSSNIIVKEVNSFCRRILRKYYVNTTKFPTMKHRFTAVYSRDKEYLFDLDMPEFFSPATHSRIVNFILDRTRFTEDKEDDFAFGIERLITEKAYVAAYPLHDVSIQFFYFLFFKCFGVLCLFTKKECWYLKKTRSLAIENTIDPYMEILFAYFTKYFVVRFFLPDV